MRRSASKGGRGTEESASAWNGRCGGQHDVRCQWVCVAFGATADFEILSSASLRTGPSLRSGQALRFAQDRPFASLRTGPSLRSGLARDCNGVGIASFGRSFVGPAAPGLLRMTTREALIRMDNDNAFQDESGAGPPQDDSLTVILSEPSDRGRGCHPEGAAKRRPKDRVFSQGHLHSLRTTNGLPAAVCDTNLPSVVVFWRVGRASGRWRALRDAGRLPGASPREGHEVLARSGPASRVPAAVRRSPCHGGGPSPPPLRPARPAADLSRRCASPARPLTYIPVLFADGRLARLAIGPLAAARRRRMTLRRT